MDPFPLTLHRHIFQEHEAEMTPGEFSRLMGRIALAGKIISRDLSRASLEDLLGKTGTTNIQGEAVEKLDQRANAVFVRAMADAGGLVKAVVSEEMEQPWEYADGGAPETQYALFLDPLDGSSNLDANMTVGSIFSVHRIRGGSDWQPQLLKRGTEQVAAGYVLYGPSTTLVYTAGAGIHQFTLDPSTGEFVLARSRFQMPAKGKVYSVNEGNYNKWDRRTQRFTEWFREKDPPTGRPYSTRYSGCLVADVHRLLTSGGIYFYPAEAGKNEGKLRLMYEGAPLAFVLEQAGGRASTGTARILDVHPTAVHQRTALFIGSREEVALAEEFIQGKR